MTLKDMIQADSLNVFINADEFAEHVYYGPFGGMRREINAVVFREAVATSEESGGISTPFFEVHVANDSTFGISSTELNLGGDVIEFPVRPGMSNSSRRILAVIAQDEGMLVLQCQ